MIEFSTPPADEDFTTNKLTKGARTRQEILQAAFTLFTAQGYHGTSMRQIARQAGIALGSIYNHFKSKEEIFEAVTLMAHPIHSILPALEHSRGETVDDVVRQSASQMFETLAEQQEFLNLMFIETVEFKGQHLPRMFSEMFPRALRFSTRLQKKRGRLRPEIPLPVMVVTFTGLVFAFYIFQRVFGRQTQMGSPQEMLQQVIDIYLYGILQEKDS
jgi:AcrR family transcriptional regulator